MIDGRTIADLRCRLVMMLATEAQKQGQHEGPHDLFAYEIFLPVIGDLLAMADGFRKLRCVHESYQELQKKGLSFDPTVVLGVLCKQTEQIFKEYEELEANAARANERAAASDVPEDRLP